MEFRLIIGKPPGFLGDNFLQISPGNMGFFHGRVVQENNAVFGECADGEFAMPGMADLADDEHVQWPLKNTSDLSRHDDAATRQTQHHVRLNAQFRQVETEFPACFFS